MNSLFNYELDEKQIRLTLQGAELEYSESAWLEFDNAFPGNTVSNTSISQFNFPKINFNINRNVLVPLFFIIGLGGISAIMFRFIDFKTNKPAAIEKALIPDAGNFKVEKKEREEPIQKKETPPVINAPANLAEKKIKDSVQIAANIPKTTTSTVFSNSAAIVKNEPLVSKNNYITTNRVASYPVQKTEAPVENMASNVNVTDTSASKNAMVNAEAQPQYYYYKGRRRIKKPVTVDQVETIKAPSLLSKQSPESEAEPEIIIKSE